MSILLLYQDWFFSLDIFHFHLFAFIILVMPFLQLNMVYEGLKDHAQCLFLFKIFAHRSCLEIGILVLPIIILIIICSYLVLISSKTVDCMNITVWLHMHLALTSQDELCFNSYHYMVHMIIEFDIYHNLYHFHHCRNFNFILWMQPLLYYRCCKLDDYSSFINYGDNSQV